MPGGYLLILVLGLIGMGLVDYKFKLAFWGDLRRSAAAVGIGVLAFLAWDIAGIGLGIFFIGQTSWLTGVLLAPQVPLEEPVFLLLLCYSALMGYLGFERK